MSYDRRGLLVPTGVEQFIHEDSNSNLSFKRESNEPTTLIVVFIGQRNLKGQKLANYYFLNEK